MSSRLMKGIKQRLSKKQKMFIREQLKIIKEYDECTYKHSIEVGEISAEIAKILGLKEDYIIDAYVAGLLHDLGKVDISIDIINKTDKLTVEEMYIVQKHSKLGFVRLACDFNVNNNVKVAILQHHEREDGKGYPDKISNSNIKVISKIVHVADVYSALIDVRSYKRAYSDDEALKIIKEETGSSFNRRIVEALELYVKG